MQMCNAVRQAHILWQTPLQHICWALSHRITASQTFLWGLALMLMSLTDAHWQGLWDSGLPFNKLHMPEMHLSNRRFKTLFWSHKRYAFTVCADPQGLIYIILHSQIKTKMTRRCSPHAGFWLWAPWSGKLIEALLRDDQEWVSMMASDGVFGQSKQSEARGISHSQALLTQLRNFSITQINLCY